MPTIMRDGEWQADGLLEQCIAHEATIAKLRTALEEFADTEHHSPPVPLWISQKARKALLF